MQPGRVSEVRKLEVDFFVAAAQHLRDHILHIIPDYRPVRMAAVVELEVEVDRIEHCRSAWVLWRRIVEQAVIALPIVVSCLKSKLIYSKLICHFTMVIWWS